MEIRIKTHEELRADCVTIEITGTGAEVTEFAETRLPSRNLYTDDEVAALQASEAELVAGPLRHRIAELERMLAGAIDREAGLEEGWAADHKEIVALREKVHAFNLDRKTERDRADRERQRASELKDRLSSSEGLVQEERTRGNNLAERLAKAEKALAESRELVAFKNRILNDKDDELREVRGHADQLKKRAEDAESKLMAGHVCTAACSENQHVAFVGRKALTEMENQVAELTRQIDNARVILADPQLEDARKSIVTRNTIALDKAIGKALDALA